MKSIYGFVLAFALLSGMIGGCTSGTNRAEDGNKFYVANENYVNNNNGNDLIPENIYSETETEYGITHNSQLDYLVRRDLGFPKIERIINTYEQTIKNYATRYGFDWRLILAVMNQESRFRVQAVSHRGASGLMQIMPVTGRDISVALGIENVSHPENNIAGGVYYLWWAYHLFEPREGEQYPDITDEDRVRLALAAYNGGPTRVRDAQRIARYLDLNPYLWDNIRDILPMLSYRYNTLHGYVWEGGRPAGGYFNGSAETINYVDSVMGYYSYYKQLFD